MEVLMARSIYLNVEGSWKNHLGPNGAAEKGRDQVFVDRKVRMKRTNRANEETSFIVTIPIRKREFPDIKKKSQSQHWLLRPRNKVNVLKAIDCLL